MEYWAHYASSNKFLFLNSLQTSLTNSLSILLENHASVGLPYCCRNPRRYRDFQRRCRISKTLLQEQLLQYELRCCRIDSRLCNISTWQCLSPKMFIPEFEYGFHLRGTSFNYSGLISRYETNKTLFYSNFLITLCAFLLLSISGSFAQVCNFNHYWPKFPLHHDFNVNSDILVFSMHNNL